MRYVECPICGRQYLPHEIFIPKFVFGTSTYIERDSCGKIVSFMGDEMILCETYDCDNCNASFEVEVSMEFTSKIPPHKNFIEEF